MVKITIATQGCSHNYSDSEHMAGLLVKAGHELVQEEDAEVVLFNTCTVKTPTETAFLRKLQRMQRAGKKIILGGCIPQAEPARFKDYSLIGTRQLDHIVDAVEQTVQGTVVHLLKKKGLPLLSTQKVRRNPFIETIPISLGCLSACSFCKTKHARGTLESYPVEDIVDNIRRVTSEGVKEIWLTSQDTGCYGFDKETDAATLLKEICKIEKDFRIRFGMGNPHHFVRIKDKLISSYLNEKMFQFLHIPVQSG
ncbi:radical SAM protein, partial [Candidatus Woesearchaeota archaeon]|nr:radical SAM protein [Candidatus Woesearchaeota archaeon]